VTTILALEGAAVEDEAGEREVETAIGQIGALLGGSQSNVTV